MCSRRKSDNSIVSEKSLNNDACWSTEKMEKRELAKGNSDQGSRFRAQIREYLSQDLYRVREAAQREKRMKFTTLWHHVYNINRLREAYFRLKKNSAAGVDGETWISYGEDLETNLDDLSARLKRGGYRAPAVKRVYIPKADGRQRPIGIPTLEDKIVQSVTSEVLQCVYEVDFKDFSYGFRPGRSQHDALDALFLGLKGSVNWVLDADISGFFDAIDHEWLMKFVEHRIGDTRVLRHIRKWLKAGVLEDGILRQTEMGTPQGGSISPLLANIYLHYAFDNWAQRWDATGVMHITRYADDFIVGFENRADAQKFLTELHVRLGRFNLKLHPVKTRLIEFGRCAASTRRVRGEGKPETFDFLGFTHICGKTRQGKFTVVRKSKQKRVAAKLKELRMELRQRLHAPVNEVGKWLRSVVQGHYNYYGVPGNMRSLQNFRFQVVWHWRRSLSRRSQKGYCTWQQLDVLTKRWIPYPCIVHPFPWQRTRVTT